MRPLASGASEPNRRWYAVYSLPAKEKIVAEQLQCAGLLVFLPQRLRTFRHARREWISASPLFPRYLFVLLDNSLAGWRMINTTRGVSHLVTFGERPAPVPRGVIEALVAATENGLVSFKRFLEPGQSVRFLAGPFADQLGTLQRLDSSGAVKVLVDIMGRSVEVSCPQIQISPAE